MVGPSIQVVGVGANNGLVDHSNNWEVHLLPLLLTLPQLLLRSTTITTDSGQPKDQRLVPKGHLGTILEGPVQAQCRNMHMLAGLGLNRVTGMASLVSV